MKQAYYTIYSKIKQVKTRYLTNPCFNLTHLIIRFYNKGSVQDQFST